MPPERNDRYDDPDSREHRERSVQGCHLVTFGFVALLKGGVKPLIQSDGSAKGSADRMESGREMGEKRRRTTTLRTEEGRLDIKEAILSYWDIALSLGQYKVEFY